jgi:KaiC domain protein
MIRLSTGIDGLNKMMGGGIPLGHTVAVIGPAGTGKTTFGLQFVWDGLIRDQKCIFISLEEEEEALLKTALSYGWNLRPYVERGDLSLIKLDPADISTSMERLESDLPSIIASFGASRVVVDPFTLLEMLVVDEMERRRKIFELCRMIGNSGTTTILTSEVARDNPYVSRFGLVEYVVDGIILLHRVLSEDRSRAQLAIELVKMRRTDHSKEVKPYTITQKGIIVHSNLKISLRNLTRY